MANNYTTQKVHSHVLEVTTPGVDYGLKNDDGYDPSKYEFYNPSNRSATTSFVVRLDDQHLKSDATPCSAPENPPESYETDSPPPLSPIEELDDDLITSKPRRNIQRGPSASSETEESKSGFISLANPSSSGGNAVEPATPLEKRSELLFSREHLQSILAHSALSLKFTDFLHTYRPDSVPILAYYLDVIKAVKTINYAEAIIKGLEPVPGHAFTSEANNATMAWVMEDKADRAVDVLVKDDLPAFIAYIYVRTVDVALVERVTGNERLGSRSIADGLAEVFVLSDPSRPDNPIVFTSEEFHRMTGYPRTEFLGRNCRTLGGARTSLFGIARFRASLDAEREHCEVLLNYRKDGSPFINLIMCVPLRDQSGKVRYYLGAQLDITGLVNDCTGLTTLQKIVDRNDADPIHDMNGDSAEESLQKDEFEQLSEAFNPQELEKLITLRRRQQLRSHEGVVYTDSERRQQKYSSSSRNSFTGLEYNFQLDGQGSAPPLGYYKTYLLVRPYPSLRILFASPDLRIPGILQSPLLSRIGGSARVRADLAHALEVGRKVTAKVQWLSKSATTSRARWIHCTPLLGVNDNIGVWMVILVDDEDVSHETRDSSRRGSKHGSETLPWDEKLDRARSSDIITGTKDNIGKPLNPDDISRPQARRPMFRQPSDMDDPTQKIFSAGQGPKDGGRAIPLTSNSDHRVSLDDDGSTSIRETDNWHNSQSSSIMPIQSNMQPKLKIAGRPSFEGDGARRAPINMPGRADADREASIDGRPSTRRTYKSLSPYGILFED